jgi:hypothetical protein
MPLIKPSPEWPNKVELETLAAKSEIPTTNQFSLLPERKYSAAFWFLLFFNAYQIVNTKNARILTISIHESVFIYQF